MCVIDGFLSPTVQHTQIRNQDVIAPKKNIEIHSGIKPCPVFALRLMFDPYKIHVNTRKEGG